MVRLAVVTYLMIVLGFCVWPARGAVDPTADVSYEVTPPVDSFRERFYFQHLGPVDTFDDRFYENCNVNLCRI